MGEFQEGTGDNRVWPSHDFTWNPLSVLMIFVIVSGQIVAGSNNVEDVEKVMADAPMLQQKMKSRHLTMIAVGMDFSSCKLPDLIIPCTGGSIGTGLFVGSGSALAIGGPAGLLIAWFLIGVMLINVTQVCHVQSTLSAGCQIGLRQLAKCRSSIPFQAASIRGQSDSLIHRSHLLWAGIMYFSGLLHYLWRSL